MISIIIPNKDQINILKPCIDSIISKTTLHQDFEILIIENNSDSEETFHYYSELINSNLPIRVIIYNEEGPFNYAKLNNKAVQHASGEYILFLNNDTEVISPNWLEEMLKYFNNNEKTGAVGAKLYYPDGSIQHAGVAIGVNKVVADHPFKGIPPKAQNHKYKAKRLNTPQYVMAVTGACLLTKKELFLKMGGFDENLALAYNDVDYCLKLDNVGYNIIWTPLAELYHHESLTRGYEDTQEKFNRLMSETKYLTIKWEKIFKNGGDKFHPYCEVKE